VRGEVYRLRHEYDRTIVDCNEALKLRPHLAMALATRGAAFRQKGDFATALADLRQAVRLEPTNQFARDQMRLAEQRRK
jgi:tetratricopeptide (TPR) repeat protein